MFISACLIIKNEENVIERCINSYKEVVNEIIVVDTGSTDRSVEIAQALGATIYSFEWINDFAAARNFAISKARGEWIIFLDADEFFKEGDARALTSSLEMVKSYDAVSVKLINVTNDMETMDEMFLYRVFKNNHNMEYINPIHEVLSKRDGTIKNAIFSDVIVYHTGYDQSVIHKQDKIKRNYKLLKEELNKKPNDYTIHAYLTEHFLLEKQWEKAICHAKEAIKNADNYEDIFVSKAYIGMLQAMSFAEKDAYDRIAVINEGLIRIPNNSDLFYCAGVEAFLQKMYKEAIFFLEKALELRAKMRISKISGILEGIYYKLYVAYQALDNKKMAINSLSRMLKIKKNKDDIVVEWLYLISKSSEINILDEIKKVYDIKANQEIYYLLIQAVKLRSNKLVNLLYGLLNIPEKRSNVISLYFLFVNKRYTQASIHFLDVFEKEQNEEYEAVTFMSGLLAKDESILKKVKHITTNKSLKKLIDYLVENKRNDFTSEDKLTYLQVVQDLILLGEFEALDQIIQLKDLFKNNIDLELGNLFYKYDLHDLALPIYFHFFKNGKDADLLIRVVKILLGKGQKSEAMKMLSLGMEFGIEDFEVYRLIAETAKLYGDELLVKEITNVAKKHFTQIGNYEVTLV